MDRKFSRGPAMRDVAEAAGVSAQTVSRVLSDHPNVQEATRERVLDAVARLGYRRNNTARALVTGQSMTLGMLTLSTSSYSRSALALGVEVAAREAGYAVNSVTCTLSAASLSEAASRLVHQGVDGIIIAAPLVEAAEQIRHLTARIPTVMTDGSMGPFHDSVGVDQARAAAVATTHLLELGHETVWQVAGPESWPEAVARVTSWQEVLQAAGRECPPPLHGDWSPEAGYRVGLILAQKPEVTAILAGSDEMAFGILRALAETGRRVPEDVSVVSIDDIELAAYTLPPLTTVRQPFEDNGRRAVHQLLARIADPDLPRSTTLSTPTLVVRASTAPPPGH